MSISKEERSHCETFPVNVFQSIMIGGEPFFNPKGWQYAKSIEFSLIVINFVMPCRFKTSPKLDLKLRGLSTHILWKFYKLEFNDLMLVFLIFYVGHFFLNFTNATSDSLVPLDRHSRTPLNVINLMLYLKFAKINMKMIFIMKVFKFEK